MERQKGKHTADGQDPFRTTLIPWLKPLFAGICRGMIRNQGLLGAEISSIHSMIYLSLVP